MATSNEQSQEAAEEDARQYRLIAGIEDIEERYPSRPQNHSKTLRFSDLYTYLFNPLIHNQKGGARINGGVSAAATKATNRRKVGPHGPLVGKLSAQELRRQIIERFIAKWRTEVGPDFFPALRLILPDKDRDRGNYGLKEHAIGRLLVKVMNIDRKSEDGTSLLHWKVPGQSFAARLAGDFPGRCYEILQKRQMKTEPGSLTIADVNELLDMLAAASGEAETLTIFQTFYSNMNAEEMLWVIRIIMKQMRVGATEKTMLSHWHPDAEALFNVSSDLRRVCWELHDPKIRLQEENSGITLMQCFQPQLAQFQMPVPFERLVEYLRPDEEDREFWIEEKLDGERMQMHMQNDSTVPGGKRFCWFSRKTKNYTYLYGETYFQQDSALTRHLRDCFDPNVRDVILDGEMITWDPENDLMMPFGTLKSAAIDEKQRSEHQSGYQPFFCVFDIVYLNGMELTKYTLRDRRAALHRAIRQHKRKNDNTGSTDTVHGIHRRLEVHPYLATSSASAIEPALRDVVARASEGLVLKNPRSSYRLNSRNDDWIKAKPEYMTEFGESLDCVVIGGYYGSGRRGGILSSYLCGLRVSQNDVKAGANPEKCLSFFKVGGGLRAEDYANIRHHTDGKWKQWNSTRPPTEYIELAPGTKTEKPDMWIRPSESVVLEVKAASVAPSDSFATGKTLRFPRFRRLRLDKAWDMALSVDEFATLQERVDEETRRNKEMVVETRRRQTANKRLKKDIVIAGTDRVAADSKDTMPTTATSAARTETSSLFAGLEFCIMSDASRPKKYTKAQLEALVRSHSGTIRQRVTAETVSLQPEAIRVVAEKKLVSVASLIKQATQGSLDVTILTPKWILDCLEQAPFPYQTSTPGFLLPYENEHVLFSSSNAVLESVRQNKDCYGDSYARDIPSLAELVKILDDMPKAEDMTVFDREGFLTELESEGYGRLVA